MRVRGRRALLATGVSALALAAGLPLLGGSASAQSPGFSVMFTPSTGGVGTAMTFDVTGCSASQVLGAPALLIEIDTDSGATGSGARDVTTYAFASPSGTTLHYSAPPEFDYAAGHGVGPTYPVRVRCNHTTAGVAESRVVGSFTYTGRAPTTSTSSTTSTTSVLPDSDDDDPPTTTTTGLPDLFVASGASTPTTTTTVEGDLETTTTTTEAVTPTTAGILSNANPLPGDLVAFASSGFGPGTVVHVELQSTPVPLGDFVVAADGTVSGKVRIPTNTLAGFHDIVLKGVDPSGAQLVRHLPVLVGSAGGRIPRTGDGNDALLRIALLLVGVGSLAIGRSLVRTSRPTHIG